MDDLRERLFGSRETCEAFGLSEAHLRRLIQWKGLVPAEGGRGRGKTRRLSFGDAEHLGVVSALYRSGLSLQMAHTLGRFFPRDRNIMGHLRPDRLAENEPDRFAQLYSAAEPDYFELNEAQFQIFNGRWVVLETRADKFLLGEMVDGGQLLYLMIEPVEVTTPDAPEIHDSSLLIRDDWPPENERHQQLEAEFIAEAVSPIDIRLVNVDRCLVLGFRRLLGLEVTYPAMGRAD